MMGFLTGVYGVISVLHVLFYFKFKLPVLKRSPWLSDQCMFVFGKLSKELINHSRRLRLRSLCFYFPPLIPEAFLASISGFTRLLCSEGGGAWDTTGSPCQEVFWESTLTALFAASISLKKNKTNYGERAGVDGKAGVGHGHSHGG